MTTLMAIGEAFVVDAELMEDGSLQVVDVNGVLGNVDAVIVGLAVGDTPAHATAGEPVGEAVGMMVAAIGSLGELALAVNGTAEFSAPDNESIVEHAALLKIAQECGGGLIGVATLHADLFRRVAVGIPAAVLSLIHI